MEVYKELVTSTWKRWVAGVTVLPLGCMGWAFNEEHDPSFESVVAYTDRNITPTYRYHFIFFDFDNSVALEYAQRDAYMFVQYLQQRHDVRPEMLGMFFSGQKGFHVLLPIGACIEEGPYVCSGATQGTIRTFANALAGGFHSWDGAVYDSRRLMRIANTRHPHSGLFKIPISYSELAGPLETIMEAAHEQRDVPDYVEEWHGDPPLNEVFTQCEVLQQQVTPRSVRGGVLRDYFLPADVGERNTSAAKLAGLLRKADVNLELAQMIMAMWNRQNAQPLDPEELSRLVHNIYKRY